MTDNYPTSDHQIYIFPACSLTKYKIEKNCIIFSQDEVRGDR